jgi:hypothetical protein
MAMFDLQSLGEKFLQAIWRFVDCGQSGAARLSLAT